MHPSDTNSDKQTIQTAKKTKELKKQVKSHPPTKQAPNRDTRSYQQDVENFLKYFQLNIVGNCGELCNFTH